jgi:hypothetical protein
LARISASACSRELRSCVSCSCWMCSASRCAVKSAGHPALVFGPTFAAGARAFRRRDALLAVGRRKNHVGGLADHLAGRIAEQSLCTDIPAYDQPIGILHDDGVVACAFGGKVQLRHAVAGALLGGAAGRDIDKGYDSPVDAVVRTTAPCRATLGVGNEVGGCRAARRYGANVLRASAVTW